MEEHMERITVTRDRHGNVIRSVEVYDYWARRVFYARVLIAVMLICVVIGFVGGTYVSLRFGQHGPLHLW